MVDADLIRIFCCPETRQSVTLADRGTVEKLNEAITAGRVKNRAGRLVSEPVEAGLIREDGRVCYPVVHGLPVLLVDEGIALMESD